MPRVTIRPLARKTHRDDVMLVEDDPESRDALSTVLEMHGLHVGKAVDGQDALDQLHAGYRRCAILLDLRMPRMDGWGFATSSAGIPSCATSRWRFSRRWKT